LKVQTFPCTLLSNQPGPKPAGRLQEAQRQIPDSFQNEPLKRLSLSSGSARSTHTAIECEGTGVFTNSDSPVPTLLTETEAARLLRRSLSSLRRHRKNGSGPSFVRIGSSVRYRFADIMAFVEAHVISPSKGGSHA